MRASTRIAPFVTFVKMFECGIFAVRVFFLYLSACVFGVVQKTGNFTVNKYTRCVFMCAYIYCVYPIHAFHC